MPQPCSREVGRELGRELGCSGTPADFGKSFPRFHAGPQGLLNVGGQNDGRLFFSSTSVLLMPTGLVGSMSRNSHAGE